MHEIEVRVVSLEEADHDTAEFWLGGQLFGFTRLEEGELVLMIEPRDHGRPVSLMPIACAKRSPTRNTSSSPIEKRDHQ